jgi:hypothetical protein
MAPTCIIQCLGYMAFQILIQERLSVVTCFSGKNWQKITNLILGERVIKIRNRSKRTLHLEDNVLHQLNAEVSKSF